LAATGADDEFQDKAADDIYTRDYSAPTGEDQYDKTILPKVMQVWELHHITSSTSALRLPNTRKVGSLLVCLNDHMCFSLTPVHFLMQVKNFGRRGRTKYTHLLDQDTTVSAAASRFDCLYLCCLLGFI
jgi:Microfibril-associated/Pre-mRNA processing